MEWGCSSRYVMARSVRLRDLQQLVRGAALQLQEERQELQDLRVLVLATEAELQVLAEPTGESTVLLRKRSSIYFRDEYCFSCPHSTEPAAQGPVERWSKPLFIWTLPCVFSPVLKLQMNTSYISQKESLYARR